jgi:hypothetical protein
VKKKKENRKENIENRLKASGFKFHDPGWSFNLKPETRET